MNIRYFIIILIIFFECCTQQKQNIPEEEFYEIDLEQCLKSEQQVLLSDIADTIEYLELKTPRGIIISGIKDVIFVNEFLFFRAGGFVYKFLRNGQFVCQIGSKGRGPGEYQAITSLYIDEINKEIVVGAIETVLFYSFEGIFLRSLRRSCMGLIFSDSVMWTAITPGSWQKYQAIAFAPSGDTCAYISNGNFGKSRMNGGIYFLQISHNRCPFYKYNGSVYFKGFEDNDTIWKLSGHQAKPYVYLNLGRYKLPYEFTIGYSAEAFEKHAIKYMSVPVIAEEKNYFFFIALNRKVGALNYLAFDKRIGKGFNVSDGKAVGITDNILGGPHLLLVQESDKYFFDVVEGVDLLENIEQNQYTPIPEFKKQLETISENTNQLIILCHKKNIQL